MQTFLPFDTDDLAVHSLDDGRVAVVAGRGVMNFKPAEAHSLGDALAKAAALIEPRPAFLGPAAVPVPTVVDDAMLKRAVDAFEQWWCDYAKTPSTETRAVTSSLLHHVLNQSLQVCK